jgi:hypothetical protein
VLGPDSSLAPLIAAAVLRLAAADASDAAALAATLGVLVGLLCIASRLARFGFITDLVSRPIRSGYINGIALTVFVGQLPKLYGFSSDGDGFLREAIAFASGFVDGESQPAALTIGLSCLLILGFRRWRPPGAERPDRGSAGDDRGERVGTRRSALGRWGAATRFAELRSARCSSLRYPIPRRHGRGDRAGVVRRHEQDFRNCSLPHQSRRGAPWSPKPLVGSGRAGSFSRIHVQIVVAGID